MGARLVAVAVGIWLMLAPAALGYGDPGATNDRISGPIIGGFAFVAIWEVVRPLRWATLPFGAWLVLAPLVLGYGHLVAGVNSVACGAAVVLSAPLGARTGQDRKSVV